MPVSLAGVHVVDANTFLAAHIAAPVEDAVAFLFAFLSPGIVTSSTAQQIAAVYPVRCHIAGTPPCPEGASLWVGVTEVWRGLIVHKVPLSGRFEQ